MLDRLPSIVLDLIIDQLNYLDIFNLKLCCKRLKNELNSKVNKDLIIYVENNADFNNLFFTNQLVYYSNSIRIECPSLLRSNRFKSNFRQLKKLVIYYFSIYISNQATYDLIIDLNDLNDFYELEQLEISKFNVIKGKLVLRNLKICRIDTAKVSEFKLKCDRLQALSIEDGARPDLVGQTDNLVYLQSIFVFDDNYLLDLCSKCKHLTTICSNKIHVLVVILSKINRDILKLPINEVKVERVFDFESDRLIYELMILNEKRKNLKFYFNDKQIRLEDLMSLKELIRNFVEFVSVKRIFKSRLNFLNYDYLLYLDSNSIHLHFLFSSVRNVIINDESADTRILGKLVNLRRCIISTIKLSDQLLDCIIANCRKLTFLIFEFVDLDSEQLNKLPQHLINLRYLKIRYCKLTNIEFLAKFKNLTLVSLDLQLKKEHFKYLLDNCPNLQLSFPKRKDETKFIAIKFKEGSFRLPNPFLKYSKINLYLIRDDLSNRPFLSLDSLLKYFYSKSCYNQIDFSHSIK